MNESTTKTTRHFTGCASLAAIGVKLRQLGVFDPIRKTVRIAQKTVKHTPTDKLYDGLIAMLAGAHGLVEINTRLRSDPALQAAFGRKGYFAKQRNRRGRQLGRVLATRYGEVVVDRLFDGKTQLSKALQPLIQAAEQTLELDERKRARTLVRFDAGGGSVDDVNWLLARDYQVHGKDYSTSRAQRLAQSVSVWVDDPKVEGRQVGWVRLPANEYVRPVRRIAVRCRKANGQWGVGVLISTLTPVAALALTQQSAVSTTDPASVLLAYVYLYDQRGGGVETSFKGDHQGLGSTKRSKKRFEAQQMVMLLGSLAHNVVIWARQWLTQAASSPTKLRHYGILRMVRDVFHISGFLVFDARGQRASGILTD